MIEDMGGLRAIVNAGERGTLSRTYLFLHIALVHIDANHPLVLQEFDPQTMLCYLM